MEIEVSVTIRRVQLGQVCTLLSNLSELDSVDGH